MEFPTSALFEERSLDEVCELLGLGFTSAVGHADTANIFADVLGFDVETRRVTLTLKKVRLQLLVNIAALVSRKV